MVFSRFLNVFPNDWPLFGRHWTAWTAILGKPVTMGV
jgi:hypothetical protein